MVTYYVLGSAGVIVFTLLSIALINLTVDRDLRVPKKAAQRDARTGRSRES